MALPDDIRRRWFLPEREARALSEFVRRAGAALVPMGDPVSLTVDGRFRVQFAPLDGSQRLDAPRGWRMQQGSQAIELTTMARFRALAGRRLLMRDDMALLGLSSRPRDGAVVQSLAGLVDTIRRRDRRATEELVDRIFTGRSEHVRTLFAAVENGVLADAARPRPPFQAVWDAFRKQGLNSSEHIADIIGGKVEVNARIPIDKGGWANFCTVRISYALNQAGHRLPYVVDKTSSGADKSWHFFRVEDFEEYLAGIWGSADISVAGPVGSLTLDKIRNNQGILLFNMPGGAGWTGHATLWNGQETRDKTDHYVMDANGLKLWILP